MGKVNRFTKLPSFANYMVTLVSNAIHENNNLPLLTEANSKYLSECLPKYKEQFVPTIGIKNSRGIDYNYTFLYNSDFLIEYQNELNKRLQFMLSKYRVEQGKIIQVKEYKTPTELALIKTKFFDKNKKYISVKNGGIKK